MAFLNKQQDLGRTLLIVNPVAQSGKGSRKGSIVFDLLTQKYKQDVDLFYTKHDGHAKKFAKSAGKYDSVVVVGGDGVIHETVSGLMSIEKENRPVLGVIPVGSGNDYARSLNVSFNINKAVDQLMHSRKTDVDVGKCNDKYFAETLSFGLDAGIALDTMQARKKSKEKGFKLYFKCGVNRIKNHFDYFNFVAKLDDEREIESESIIFACQNGVTYGGGFMITPDAKLDDGYLNLCYSTGRFSRKVALPIFARTAKGHHVNNKHICFEKAKTIKLKIDREVPCQMDGEEYKNTEFTIKCLHKELTVYMNK